MGPGDGVNFSTNIRLSGEEVPVSVSDCPRPVPVRLGRCGNYNQPSWTAGRGGAVQTFAPSPPSERVKLWLLRSSLVPVLGWTSLAQRTSSRTVHGLSMAASAAPRHRFTSGGSQAAARQLDRSQDLSSSKWTVSVPAFPHTALRVCAALDITQSCHLTVCPVVLLLLLLLSARSAFSPCPWSSLAAAAPVECKLSASHDVSCPRCSRASAVCAPTTAAACTQLSIVLVLLLRIRLLLLVAVVVVSRLRCSVLLLVVLRVPAGLR